MLGRLPANLITAIGSMPHEDPRAAVDLVVASLPEAPHWPQLPRKSFLESIEQQYLEGLPCVCIDADKKIGYFDVSGDYTEALTQFYERYLEVTEGGDAEPFAISAAYAAGLAAFIAYLQSGARPRCLKGQIAGPISLGLSVTDQNRRAIIYHDEFADVVVKGVALKGYWNASLFKKYSDCVIIFIDEPVLSAFGSSAFITITREQVVKQLNEVIDLIHRAGALAGSHCCGNTDWSILAQTDIDIISFDAYNYSSSIGLYSDDVRAFLQRGARLAWGIVPTNAAIDEEDASSLRQKLDRAMKDLAALDIDISLINKQALITPSCGVGSLTLPQAERVYRILAELGSE